jgi:hypothetical protein
LLAGPEVQLLDRQIETFLGEIEAKLPRIGRSFGVKVE